VCVCICVCVCVHEQNQSFGVISKKKHSIHKRAHHTHTRLSLTRMHAHSPTHSPLTLTHTTINTLTHSRTHSHTHTHAHTHIHVRTQRTHQLRKCSLLVWHGSGFRCLFRRFGFRLENGCFTFLDLAFLFLLRLLRCV
jgi:hypothetical protein